MENEELKNENNLLPQFESGEHNSAPEAQKDADGNKYVVPGSIINKCGIWLKKKVKWMEEKFRGKDREYENKLKLIKLTIEIINEINKELEAAEEKIKKTESKILKLEHEIRNIETKIQDDITKKETELKSKKEKKAELSKSLRDESSGIISRIKSWIWQKKEARLQKNINDIDQEIKILEGEIIERKNNKSEEKKQEIEKYKKDIVSLEKDINKKKTSKEKCVMVLAENVESLSKEYEKETSVKTSLKKYAMGGLISFVSGILLASALFYGIIFYPFKKLLIGKDIVSSNTDVVAVIAYNEDYKDILLESHKFAAAKKLPIMLAGNKNVADEMEKMLALWKYPAEKVFRTASPATDLNANAEQAYLALQKNGYKTPAVFTSPVKIPRTRCEFNRYGMKTAAFINILEPLDYGMDLESGKKLVHDATSRSPYSIGTIFNGLWDYVSGPHCWRPGGSGKR